MRLHLKRRENTDAPVEVIPNRKDLRARSPRPSVRELRFASLCLEVAKDFPAAEGERPSKYIRRIRGLAAQVQHEQRKAKRTAARAARKRNR